MLKEGEGKGRNSKAAPRFSITYKRWRESPLSLATVNGDELQKWRKQEVQAKYQGREKPSNTAEPGNFRPAPVTVKFPAAGWPEVFKNEGVTLPIKTVYWFTSTKQKLTSSVPSLEWVPTAHVGSLGSCWLGPQDTVQDLSWSLQIQQVGKIVIQNTGQELSKIFTSV